jgi:hypothetical protein
VLHYFRKEFSSKYKLVLSSQQICLLRKIEQMALLKGEICRSERKFYSDKNYISLGVKCSPDGKKKNDFLGQAIYCFEHIF